MLAYVKKKFCQKWYWLRKILCSQGFGDEEQKQGKGVKE